jgi:hypothetical protein
MMERTLTNVYTSYYSDMYLVKRYNAQTGAGRGANCTKKMYLKTSREDTILETLEIWEDNIKIHLTKTACEGVE